MNPICSYCNEKFKRYDDVVTVDEDAYHADCIELYPTGYVAMTKDGDFLGESDNDDGQWAIDIFDELLDEEEELV